jgi:hypothetical protein
MFVCCECCVLSGRGLCDELITRPEESYRLWCVVCDLEKPQEWGGHEPHWVAAPQRERERERENIYIYVCIINLSCSLIIMKKNILDMLLYIHFHYLIFKPL